MDAIALPTSAADMAAVFAQGEEAVRLAFALLREADERINKVYRSVLEDAIEASTERAGYIDLFAFKLHYNGNLHLEFLRTDLLKKLNMRAGGKNLRPARAD